MFIVDDFFISLFTYFLPYNNAEKKTKESETIRKVDELFGKYNISIDEKKVISSFCVNGNKLFDEYEELIKERIAQLKFGRVYILFFFILQSFLYFISIKLFVCYQEKV